MWDVIVLFESCFPYCKYVNIQDSLFGIVENFLLLCWLPTICFIRKKWKHSTNPPQVWLLSSCKAAFRASSPRTCSRKVDNPERAAPSTSSYRAAAWVMRNTPALVKRNDPNPSLFWHVMHSFAHQWSLPLPHDVKKDEFWLSYTLDGTYRENFDPFFF